MSEEEKVDLAEAEDMQDEIIELEDDDGNVVPFSWIGTFEYKEQSYVVFEPAEPTPDFEDGEAVIFKLSADEEGNDLFLPIEDEATLQEVFAEFLRLYEEENGCDCGEDCCGDNCGCGEKECDCHGDCGSKK